MNLARGHGRFCAIALFAITAAASAGNPKVRTDPSGDAVLRPTDPEMCGHLGPGGIKPDLLKLSLGAWQSNTASTNPYAGFYAEPEHANLFRLDLEIKGVVCPPGTVALTNYNPFQFGASPLYGFIELDIDSDHDTGGELTSAGKSKYLANVGRFGLSPQGSIHDRFVSNGRSIDSTFETNPQFERSGADFLLAFCGCYPTTITTEGGNGNHIFEAGETWIIQGGFFQRAGGYQPVCSSTGGAAGLQIGLYVPLVKLRWSHSTVTDTTTVTLVYSLTQQGSAQLAGQSVQPINLNVSDQTSIVEALTDVAQGAQFAPAGSPAWYLSHRWIGHNPSDPSERDNLDPTRWDVTALIGTTFETPIDTSFIAWTDTGFEECPLDLDGDGLSGPLDRQLVRDRIDELDGTLADAEGQAWENGSVRLIQPGLWFESTDVDADGRINRLDIGAYCPADFNKDGAINILDYLSFMNAFAAADPQADFNHNGILDVLDFIAFQNAAAAGC